MIHRTFFFSQPSRIMFGYGNVGRAGKEARNIASGDRAQIVTDSNLKEMGFVKPVIESLEDAGFEVNEWTGVSGEPHQDQLEEAYEDMEEFSPDVFIGLGGGSCIDTAKICAGMMTNPEPLASYFPEETGVGRFSRPPKPILAIPTTAGTGAENTWFAVTGLRDVPGKVGFVDSKLIPSRAIVDPELTIGLPPSLTAMTGMDALTHLIEGYLSKQSNPLNEALARGGVEKIPRYIRRAVEDGKDREARFHMMMQATLGGLAINYGGVNEGHIVGHMLGERYHIPHGVAQGITLPYCLDYNLSEFPDQIALLAESWGLDTSGLDRREAGRELVGACVSLLQDLDMPWKLSQVEDAREEDLPAIAEAITTTPYFVSTAKSCCAQRVDKGRCLDLLKKMYVGDF